MYDIVINNEIDTAEKDIFGKHCCFNKQQIDFLKCLDSCCVQAYAGTGKTTTIVGKLHILAQKKIWQNGRGICVISHTNVAIDEIKKHVVRHYPEVVRYPNFVGTIQEFENKFLFIPYLAGKGLKIRFQDEFRYFYKSDLKENLKKRICNYINSRINHSKNKEEVKKIFLERLFSVYYYNNKLYANDKKNNKISEFVDLKTKEFDQNLITNLFREFIDRLQQEGKFLFRESFIYGFDYLKENPILKNIIAQRFKYVFLDEAQDCSDIQLKILNELFCNSKVVFQQIGDVNQAISETEWKPNSNCLSLNHSTRFGNNITELVNKFQVYDGKTVSGVAEDTKKYIIIYDHGKEKDILKIFVKILEIENISTDKGFFAISHMHKQLRIYFDYSEKIAKNKNKKTYYRFDQDIEYINTITSESIREKGSNFVSKILFSLLYKYFKINNNSMGDLREYLLTSGRINILRMLILELSKDILENEQVSNLSNLKDKLNFILGENKINLPKEYNSSSNKFVQNQLKENKFNYNDIEVNIGTIHSVKGQTHSATLCFLNKEHDKYDVEHALLNNGNIRTLLYKRLLYVASSRSKYLLAFAMEKNGFDSLNDKSVFQDFKQIVI